MGVEPGPPSDQLNPSVQVGAAPRATVRKDKLTVEPSPSIWKLNPGIQNGS